MCNWTTKGDDRKNGAEKIFEEIIAKDFPNLILKKHIFTHKMKSKH